MSPNPIGNDARKQTRSRRLPAGARCYFCAVRNPVVLKVYILDEHHPLTKRLAPTLTVVLCRNHHDITHEDLRDFGAVLRCPPENVLENIKLLLTTTARFLTQLGEALMVWVGHLEAFIGALDSNLPTWRELPEATP